MKRQYIKKEKVAQLQQVDKKLFDKLLKTATFIKTPKTALVTNGLTKFN